MTLSPDERARALLDALLDAGTIEQLGRADPVPIIADAIRQACNEKLEEAASAALKALGGPAHTYVSENADIYRAQDHALAVAAERIRSLKDTSP
jgi:hypothetical protein